jgi:hypothetical protein
VFAGRVALTWRQVGRRLPIQPGAGRLKGHVRRLSGYSVRSSIPAGFVFIPCDDVFTFLPYNPGEKAKRWRRRLELSDVTDLAVPENGTTRAQTGKYQQSRWNLTARLVAQSILLEPAAGQHRSHEITTLLVCKSSVPLRFGEYFRSPSVIALLSVAGLSIFTVHRPSREVEDTCVSRSF